jgi:hypothetical protein
MEEEAKWQQVTEGVPQLLSLKDGFAIINKYEAGANGR